MDSHPSASNRHARLPIVVSFLGLGIIVALIAIYILNVPVGTVIYFGLLALMLTGQFMMNRGVDDENGQDNQSSHIRGCH